MAEKKKEDKMVVKEEKKRVKPVSMMSIYNSLRKTFGNDSVFSGDDVALDTAEPISTGSYALDDAIGILGVPRGLITQFAGAEGSGKTLMALQVVKNWQAKDPDNWALWIDAERSYMKQWAEGLGVDTDRLLVITDSLGSSIFNMLCGIPNPKNPSQKIKLGALDEMIAAGPDNKCGVIVIDSIAAIEPPVEATYEVGHQNMAAMARFMPQVLRRVVSLVSEANVAFIAINQIRVDPGVQYGNPETTPGGKAWKHACSLMINFAKSTSKEKQILGTDENPIGHTMRAKIQKSRLAIPTDTEFVVKYLTGVVNKNVEVVDLGIKYGIIQRPNNVMYVYGDNKWKGRQAVEQAFTDDTLFGEMWEKVKVARKTYVVESPVALQVSGDEE